MSPGIKNDQIDIVSQITSYVFKNVKTVCMKITFIQHFFTDTLPLMLTLKTQYLTLLHSNVSKRLDLCYIFFGIMYLHHP